MARTAMSDIVKMKCMIVVQVVNVLGNFCEDNVSYTHNASYTYNVFRVLLYGALTLLSSH